MPEVGTARGERARVAREVKQAIVYVKDLDGSPDELPEDVLIFRREDDNTPTLDLDSLDALELGILFEERYGLGIGSEIELTENTTLGEVVDFLVRYFASRSPA